MQPTIALLRPPAQAMADVDVCHQAGWTPLLCSPMRLVADQAALRQLAIQWQQVDAVFWVSPGAVDMAAAQLPLRPPQAVQVAVGAATAARLAAYGVKDVLFPSEGNDSEAVLQLPYWQRHAHRCPRLLIVRGHGGRAMLGSVLRDWGWQVDYAQIYDRQTQPIDWQHLRSVWQSGQLQAVYVTTVALVQMWFAQMPFDLCHSLKSLLYFTQHPRVAAALQQHGVYRIQTGSLAAQLPCVATDALSVLPNFPETPDPLMEQN